MNNIDLIDTVTKNNKIYKTNDLIDVIIPI